MTGPWNLNVSVDFVSGDIEILGKQNSLFPSGPDQSLSVYYSTTGFLLLLRARPKILFSSTGFLSCVPGLRFYPETSKYRVFGS